MYDNVNLKLPMEYLTEEELTRFKTSMQYKNTSYRSEEHITERFISKSHRFEASISKNLIKIYKFSLPSFLYGTNEVSFDFNETTKAINKLKDITGLPLEYAQVTRIDIAGNLNVSHSPTEYFKVLDTSRNFCFRIPYPNSLNYHQKGNNKRLIFYDKKAERRDKGYNLKNEFDNSLRYELKLLSSPHLRLKTKEIYLSQLSEKSLQRSLIELWKNEFDLIRIIDTKPNIFEYPIQTPKDVWDILALQKLNEEPVRTATYKSIDHLVSSGQVSYKFKENFYNKVKKVNKKTESLKYTLHDGSICLGEELKTLVMNKYKREMAGIN